MPTTYATSRASKGSVSVLSSNERLQLRFSYGGERYYLSTGYPDTLEHRKLAEIRAKEIEKDILYERFNPDNLDKYKPKSALGNSAVIAAIALPEPTLAELWEKYKEFKRPSLSPSTLAKDFVRISQYITCHLPSKSLKDAVTIRDWLVANRSPETAKMVLTQLSACCNWAIGSKLIVVNPFLTMAASIKLPKGTEEDTDIDPFTLEEQDRIIQGFLQDPHYAFYAPLIIFLFLTGCRPSEAVALQWKHIDSDFRTIRFKQAVVPSEEGLVCKEGRWVAS